MKILLNQVTVFRKGTAEKLSVLVEDGRIVSLSKEAPTLSDARVIQRNHCHRDAGCGPWGIYRRVPHAQFEAGAGQLGTSASSVRGYCPGQRDSYLSLWRHYRGRAGGNAGRIGGDGPPCGGFL